MKYNRYFAARLAAVVGLALLLGLPSAGFAQISNLTGSGQAINGTTSFTGVVQDVNRQLEYVTVRNATTGLPVKIDVRQMDTRRSINVWNLRPGDRIAVNGAWENNNTFRAAMVNTDNSNYPPMTSATTSPNLVMGTVESSNRQLNYFTIRNRATGRAVKIDVRRMDTRSSVNVWKLRPGDRIAVNGAWQNNVTFRASSVNADNFNYAPMTSASTAPNLMTGIVQSVNRQLNFVTVRSLDTGRTVKIDLRKMDTRRSIDVWQLRPGDRISVDGGWENTDTFQANRVNF